MSNKQQAVDNATYTLENFEIDYIKHTADGFVSVHVTEEVETEKPITLSSYDSELDAITDLAGTVIPESFVPYLEKMFDRQPSWDTLNNVIFVGNPNGRYDRRIGKYRLARELGMEAVDMYEMSLVEAVQHTIIAIRKLVK